MVWRVSAERGIGGGEPLSDGDRSRIDLSCSATQEMNETQAIVALRLKYASNEDVHGV